MMKRRLKYKKGGENTTVFLAFNLWNEAKQFQPFPHHLCRICSSLPFSAITSASLLPCHSLKILINIDKAIYMFNDIKKVNVLKIETF